MVKTIPSKGTRLRWAKNIGWFATIGWWISALTMAFGGATVEQIETVGVTFSNWMATMVMVLSVYATSEAVVKASEGYMNRDA